MWLISALIAMALGAMALERLAFVGTWASALAFAPSVAVLALLAFEHSLGYVIAKDGLELRGLLYRLRLKRWHIVKLEPCAYEVLRGGVALYGLTVYLGPCELAPWGTVRFYGGRGVTPAVLVTLSDGSRVVLTPRDPVRFLAHLASEGYPVQRDDPSPPVPVGAGETWTA